MRMWMLPVSRLCRKHLLGEHNELHMLTGSIVRGKKLTGFVANGLLETAGIRTRHDILATEMFARGYRHQSPLPEYEAALALYPASVQESRVDTAISLADLTSRCPECAAMFALSTQAP